MTSNISQSQLWHIYMLKLVKFGDSFLFSLKYFFGKDIFSVYGYLHNVCKIVRASSITRVYQNNCINNQKRP